MNPHVHATYAPPFFTIHNYGPLILYGLLHYFMKRPFPTQNPTAEGTEGAATRTAADRTAALAALLAVSAAPITSL